MKNKKTELRKLKKALYICTAALITNLGLSSCGTKNSSNINSEQETEIVLEETQTSEEVSVENIENLEELKTNCILFQEVPEDIEYDEIYKPDGCGDLHNNLDFVTKFQRINYSG